LANFYNVTRCKILEANIKTSKETIEQISGVLSSIREAWVVVDQKTAGQPGLTTAQEAPRVTRPVAPPAQQDETAKQLQWSA
jgi:flagellin-specific chaperone FliS